MTLATVVWTGVAAAGPLVFGVTAFSSRAAQASVIDGMTRTITGGVAT